jgi:hypothetical protein
VNATGTPRIWKSAGMLVFIGVTGQDQFSDILSYWTTTLVQGGTTPPGKTFLLNPASPLSVGVSVINAHGVTYATLIFAQ